MPRSSWSAKDERQYKHIKASCTRRGRSKKTCERIAAATVNKTRANEGRTLAGLKLAGSKKSKSRRSKKKLSGGCGCTMAAR